MTVFFTADHHFGHKSIIDHCHRPFADVPSMNAALIEAWNDQVQPGDTVWHLGDFVYKMSMSQARQIFDQLNGEKHLVIGNHEQVGRRLPWASQQAYADLTIDGQRMILSHYALRSWNASRHGTWQLYGHSHGNLPSARTSLDVGVDCWNYAPVSMPEIAARMAASPVLNFDGVEVDDGPGFVP